MRTRLVSIFALSTLVVSVAATQGPANARMTLQPESRLWVEGTSSVRGFSCKATTVNATVNAASERAVAATLAGEKAVQAVRVEVPARSLDCENGTMNGHMFKALKADQHGSIVFQMNSYELSTAGSGANIRLNGRLTLGGQERPITMTANAKAGPGGTLQVTGTQPVKLSDHGLTPPSLMMGTMKVGDVVQVKYDLILKP